jgi:hypothetical protein
MHHVQSAVLDRRGQTDELDSKMIQVLSIAVSMLKQRGRVSSSEQSKRLALKVLHQ